MYDDHKETIKQVKVQIKRLENDLNKIIDSFIKETGIPVLLEISDFESQHIGQVPRQKINVSCFIYEKF